MTIIRKNYTLALVLTLIGLNILSAACAGAPELITEVAAQTEPAAEEPVAEEPAAEEPEEEPAPEPVEPALPTATPEMPTATPPQAEPTAESAPVQAAIPEARRLVLQWPPTMRVGDSDVLRLTLEMDQYGNLVPTADIEGQETRTEPVAIPNLYDTHLVYVDARLDIANMEVDPLGVKSVQLYPGESATFYWSVAPQETGEYRGIIEVNLRFQPLDGGAEIQRALPAQIVEIRAENLLGLSGTAARTVGGLGTLLGSLIGLGDLIALGKKIIKATKKG
jgi:hypothetical protein